MLLIKTLLLLLLVYASKKFCFWENRLYVRPPLHVRRDEILHFKHPHVSAVASSQTLYFLFKVHRARVMKYKPQGIYWPPAQGGSGGGRRIARDRRCFRKERKQKENNVCVQAILAVNRIASRSFRDKNSNNKCRLTSAKEGKRERSAWWFLQWRPQISKVKIERFYEFLFTLGWR